jgi:hypothetical protein
MASPVYPRGQQGESAAEKGDGQPIAGGYDGGLEDSRKSPDLIDVGGMGLLRGHCPLFWLEMCSIASNYCLSD